MNDELFTYIHNEKMGVIIHNQWHDDRSTSGGRVEY